jgi:hypothetical protein
MAEPRESKRYIKRPHEGDVLRTDRYGDVTVNAVIRYGRHLLVTGADGEQHRMTRADDEQWLRVTPL